MNLRTRHAALALLAASALAVGGAAPAWAAEPPDIDGWVATVTGERVLERLQTLEDIAVENGGNRAAGTVGYEAATVYYEEELQAAGYETSRQEFSFGFSEVVSARLAQTAPEAREFETGSFDFAPSTPGDGAPISAGLVRPNDTPDPDPDNVNDGPGVQGCKAEDWQGEAAVVTGQIALVQRGTCTFATKSRLAAEAGAVAVIIYNIEPQGPAGGTFGGLEDAEGTVATLGISRADGEALVAQLADGAPVTVDFALEMDNSERTTWNLLAETPQGRDDNVVVVGAHLDGVLDGPGMNDNGSGAAAVLETAVQLAERPENIRNKVRFAFWGAEELGLLGSEFYVDDLVENNPDELDRIALYLNYDMVGSSNYVVAVYDGDESTFPAPEEIEIPEGSAELKKLITDEFDAVEQPWVDTAFDGRSDYLAFIENGVASSGLFSGADGSKTAEEVALFGGTEGVPYDPTYHSPEDNFSAISPEAIGIFTPSIAHSVFTLAYDTSAVNGVNAPEPTAPTPSEPAPSEPSAEPTPTEPSGEPSPTAPAPKPTPPTAPKPRPHPIADTGAGDAVLPGVLALGALTAGGLLIRRRK